MLSIFSKGADSTASILENGRKIGEIYANSLGVRDMAGHPCG